MGTIHIAGAYTDDDGSTRTFSGDLDMSPADPAQGQTIPDPNGGDTTSQDDGGQDSTGQDDGGQDDGGQDDGGQDDGGQDDGDGAGTGTIPGIPDAPAYPSVDTGATGGTDPSITDDPAQASTTNPPPDPTTGTDQAADPGAADPAVDPTAASAAPATADAGAGGSNSGGPDYPGTELRRNDAQHTAEQNVRTLQQQLSARGIDTGPVDGFFGPRTESAVRQLQQQAGVSVTGVADERTWAAAWA